MPAETQAYVRHRLKVAGGPVELFSTEAIARVHDSAGGIPRLINVLCDAALIYGYADQSHAIDTRHRRPGAARPRQQRAAARDHGEDRYDVHWRDIVSVAAGRDCGSCMWCRRTIRRCVTVAPFARCMASRPRSAGAVTMCMSIPPAWTGPRISTFRLDRPVLLDGVHVHYFRVPAPAAAVLGARPGAAGCARHRRASTVVHLHSVFLWPTWTAARIAAAGGRALHHGAARHARPQPDPRRSRWTKTAWIQLIERGSLARAAAVHVTAEIEAAELRVLGLARAPDRAAFPMASIPRGRTGGWPAERLHPGCRPATACFSAASAGRRVWTVCSRPGNGYRICRWSSPATTRRTTSRSSRPRLASWASPIGCFLGSGQRSTNGRFTGAPSCSCCLPIPRTSATSSPRPWPWVAR